MNRYERTRQFLSRHLGDRERGATATILATFLAGGVIMGMLAVSVDLGNLAYERRQVQNAADATSMALASKCAADEANCDPDNADVKSLLGANSHDDVSRFNTLPYAEGACAHGPGLPVGTVLAPCTVAGSVSELGKCPPVSSGLDPSIPYVETYVATDTIGNGDKLFLPFSRVLAGGAAGDKGSSACARAAWGKPVGYSASLPMTFSSCEWKTQTADGTDYVENGPLGAQPGYGGANPWPDVSKEVVIQLHDPGDESSDCDWNGKDTAGGFGWLDGDGDCEAKVTEDDWVHIDTGANVPQDCKDKLPALHQTVIEIPVFDCIVASSTAPSGPVPTTPAGVCDPTQPEANGNNTWYHLAGWAKFYVSGYSLPGKTAANVLPGGYNCSGSEKCLTGWFLTGALSAAPDIAPPGGDDDFGTYVVKPIG